MEEPQSRHSTAGRRLLRVGLATIAIGGGLVLSLFAALSGLPQTPISSPTPRPTFTAAAVTPAPVSVAATRASVPTAIATAVTFEANVIALVNGRPLDRQTLQTMAAADRAMAQLLGQPMPDGRDLLERLVNGELVWQAAQAAGFVVPENEVTAALDAILAAGRKSRADLEARLAANGTTFDAFMAYFRRLVTVDQFAQNQAQARGQNVSAYIAQLQARAQISFGPSAQSAVAAAVADAAAAAPSPTLRPALSSPAPTVTARPTTAPSSDPGRGVEIGQLAPDFALNLMPSVINNSYSKNDTLYLADLAGRPAVLSFWTTWCPYCARQTPVLIEAHRRYAPQGIQFVGIDVKEEPAAVEAYVQASGIPYPIGLDRDGQVAAAYRVNGFPTTYFLDAGGRIVDRHVGALTAEQLADYLARFTPSK